MSGIPIRSPQSPNPRDAGGTAPAELLVLDGDGRLTALVQAALRGKPYQLRAVTTADAALEAMFARRPDLLLITSDGSGTGALESCRELHAVADVPTIIVGPDPDTARAVAALTCADEYLAPPIALAEVAARVAAVLRRARPCRDETTPVYDDGRLRIDLRNRRVTLGGGPVHLTPTEYRLLALLVSQPERVFTYDQLLSRVWGATYTGDTHLLRLHIANLRAKIEGAGSPGYIRTHRGIGYAFHPAPQLPSVPPPASAETPADA